jgi:hypothetical protein
MTSQSVNGDRLNELWARHIDGDSLELAERAELAERLRALDIDGRAIFLRDDRLDGWLRVGDENHDSAARFADALARRLQAEASALPFVRSVEQRVRRLSSATPAGHRVAWGVAGAVAGLFMVATGLWFAGRVRPNGEAGTTSAAIPAPVSTVNAPAALAAVRRRVGDEAPGLPHGPWDPWHAEQDRAAASALLFHRREVIFRYDFEDGRQPKGIKSSPVVRCPPRPGNRFCLSAYRHVQENKPMLVAVSMLKPRHGLFTYRPDQRLSFDYWIGTPIGTRRQVLDVWLWNETQQRSYVQRLRPTSNGAWNHVDIAISDFAEEHDAARLQPGDLILELQLGTLWESEDVLFLDNIELSQ